MRHIVYKRYVSGYPKYACYQTIGGLLGTSGGAGGTGFGKPQQAQIDKPTTMGQADEAYTGAQSGLDEQARLLRNLRNQNTMGNQQNVYNQGQGLYGQLQSANGIGALGQALAGQQGLANQYQNIANGAGPNPAQAMLNQSTGANVANQAALMAGQRGAGSNVGLMARQAAQQGAGIQQQAVGQGATMQANQQLAALQGLSGANQSVAGMGNQLLGAQMGQNQNLAGIAGNQINQMSGVTNAFNQGEQSEQGQILGGIGNQNNAMVGSQGNVNSANAGLAGTTMQGQQGFIGGLMNSGATAAMMAGGGAIKPPVNMAGGGAMPSSSFGQFLSGWSAPAQTSPVGNNYQNMMAGPNPGAEKMKQGGKKGAPSEGGGGGEMIAGPDVSSMPAGAMVAAEGGLAASGGKVAAKSPDQKAVAPGNSYSNDKVPAMLSEGEIVIPRSVLQSGDPVRGAADFVAKVMAKRGKR